MVQKSMLEILDETAKFYNSNNRSVVPDEEGKNACKYIGDEGKRCAFGRCVEEDKVELLPESVSVQREFLDYLKQEYKGHNIKFWRLIQKLHDLESNWDEKGLNRVGNANYNFISFQIERELI